MSLPRWHVSRSNNSTFYEAKTVNSGIQSKETNVIESTTTAQAVFTLGFDYDRIIIKLNMKWVHINYLQSLIIIGLQLLQTTPLGLFEVITVRDCCFRWCIFLLLAFEASFAFLLASKSSIAVNIMAAVR